MPPKKRKQDRIKTTKHSYTVRLATGNLLNPLKERLMMQTTRNKYAYPPLPTATSIATIALWRVAGYHNIGSR